VPRAMARNSNPAKKSFGLRIKPGIAPPLAC
jgi:hypothetical protein